MYLPQEFKEMPIGFRVSDGPNLKYSFDESPNIPINKTKQNNKKALVKMHPSKRCLSFAEKSNLLLTEWLGNIVKM